MKSFVAVHPALNAFMFVGAVVVADNLDMFVSSNGLVVFSSTHSTSACLDGFR